MTRLKITRFTRMRYLSVNLYQPLLIIMLLASVVPLPSSAADDRPFNRRIYVGAEIGQSTLSPDIKAAGYDTSERRDLDGSVHLGYDLSEHWSLEAFYTDLGTAEITNIANPSSTSSMDYQQYGVSALAYLFNSRDEYDYASLDASPHEGFYRREGLSLFARAGASQLSSDSKVKGIGETRIQPHLGAGLEYSWGAGLSTRAEVISYNNEALQASVGFIKRFGRSTLSTEPQYDEIGKTQPAQQATLTPPYQPEIQRVQLMPPQNARRPQPPARRHNPVLIALPYLFFAPAQAQLSREAQSQLDQLAIAMKTYPRLRLRISGYPDAGSTSNTRLELAFSRAIHAKKYLKSLGITAQRMSVEGIDMTQTQHAADRGVEFSIIPNRRK